MKLKFQKDLRQMPDPEQRRLVLHCLEAGRARALKNGLTTDIVDVVLCMTPAEKDTVQKILEWPRVGWYEADSVTFHQAIMLYVMYSWEKQIPKPADWPTLRPRTSGNFWTHFNRPSP